MALEGCTPIASASAAECIGPRLAMITNARNWLTPTDSSAAEIDSHRNADQHPGRGEHSIGHIVRSVPERPSARSRRLPVTHTISMSPLLRTRKGRG